MSGRGHLVALSVGAALLAPQAVMAQAPAPQLSAKASAGQVEVGESFSIELKFAAEQGGNVEPELRPPSGFTVVGQSSIQFGSRARRGITITWQLVAQRRGHFSIPGPSVLWSGQRFSTSPIPIDVVPSTGKPQRQQGIGGFLRNNPFLSPGIQLPWRFGEEETDDEPDVREAPDLDLPSGPDGRLFLRAVADKKSVVIGEQVTLSFYIYYRTGFREQTAHEAPLNDFRRVPLLADPGAEPERRAKVGKDWFHVKLLDKVAAFPLRAGALHTGSRRERIMVSGVGLNDRETEDLIINVTEPPREGRPAGFRAGDVGQFSLTAQVEPRKIDQGSAAAVTIKVAGSGNFPESLRVPERTGVEWLDPEKKESIGPQAGIISGWRTFGYVVRVKESGKVALGTLELPYWDPTTKKYAVARVDLGALDVKPVASDPALAAPSAPPAPDPASGAPFAAVAGPRMALTAFAPPRAPLWGAGRTLWLLIAAPPLLVGLSFASAGAGRRLRARRAEGRASLGALATQALRDAEAAEQRGDRKAITAALERALHLAVEEATGLKSRGVLLADLPGELSAKGLPAPLGEEIQGALAACERLRFEPDLEGAPRGSTDAGGEGGLVARARRLVSELSRTKAP